MRALTVSKLNQRLKNNHMHIHVSGFFHDKKNNVRCYATCTKCGYKWTPLKSNLSNKKRARGCPRCNHRIPWTPKALKETIYKRSNHTNTIIFNTPYKDTKTKCLSKCLVCGYTWHTTPGSLLYDKHGNNCPMCNGLVPWTPKRAKLKIAKIFKGQITVNIKSLPKGKDTRVSAHCNKCGHNWHPVLESLLQGYGCKNCSAKHAGKIKSKVGLKHVLKWYHSQSLIKFLHPTDIKNYKNMQSRVACLCTKCGYGSHGEWTPRYADLVNHIVCPQCNDNLPLTKKVLQNIVNTNSNNTVKILKYPTKLINVNKVKLKCLRCGYVWHATIGNIKRNNGCPMCNHSLPMTLHRAQKILNTETNSSIYLQPQRLVNGEHTIVYPICKKCGYGKHNEWHESLNALLEKPRCPNCTGRFQKIPKSIIRRRINKIFHGTIHIKFDGNKTNSRDRCTATCTRDGHTWHPLIENLLAGYGCIVCGHRKSKRASQQRGLKSFKYWYHHQDTITIPLMKYYIKHYQNSRQYVLCKCNKCHSCWFARISNLKSGFGCPYCNKSHGERVVNYELNHLYHLQLVSNKKQLRNKNNCYLHSYSLHDKYGRLSIDFMIIFHDKWYGIEFDGAQHFMPADFSHKLKEYARDKNFQQVSKIIYKDNKQFHKQNHHDDRKTQWCINHKIKLIRIKNKHIYLSYKKLRKLVKKVLNPYFAK